MDKKVLIYKSPILLEIFEEIKVNLNFNFSVFSENATNNLDANDKNDYIIISHASNKIKNSYIFSVPIKLNTLLEKINILFLARKFIFSSKVKYLFRKNKYFVFS